MSANMLRNMNDFVHFLNLETQETFISVWGGVSWGTVSCQVITDLAMKVQSTFKGIVTCTIIVHVHTNTFPITPLSILLYHH